MKLFYLFLGVSLAAAGYVAYVSYPDILRYLRIRQM